VGQEDGNPFDALEQGMFLFLLFVVVSDVAGNLLTGLAAGGHGGALAGAGGGGGGSEC